MACRTDSNFRTLALALWGIISVGCSAAHSAPLSIAWNKDEVIAPGARGITIAADGRLYVASTRRENGRQYLEVNESHDGGKTFAALPKPVASDDLPIDLGDASMLAARDGSIWISYRHNHTRGDNPTYSIQVGHSVDGGKTWAVTTVATSAGERGKPSRGLWSSFLLERSDGVMQCYYDDEDAAFRGGKPGHQWITMKTWDAKKSAWRNPITASRALDPTLLSRDGMMSVVELSPMKLLMTFESVATESPHQNVIRSVTSDDGGTTWSWKEHERDVVYAAKPPFMALCPWIISLGGDRLMTVFCTDEDRDKADVSGTPVYRLNDDIKYVTSDDAGKTWSASNAISNDSHQNYLPGVVMRTVDGKMEIIVPYLDVALGKCRLVRGTLPK